MRGCVRTIGILLLLILLLNSIVGFAEQAIWPVASGDVTYKDSGTVVDASHTDQGYIMTKAKESKKSLKARVACGDNSLTYDQNSKGNYEVYSLQLGQGKYKVDMFEQVKGSKYAAKGSVKFSAKDIPEHAPFLVPNQYIWYTEDSDVVALSYELCDDSMSDMDKINTIYSHVTSKMTYNYPRALSVQSGYLPDIDAVYAEKSGICFDLSAIIACMLRVQGIPTKMVIGYADKNYHAWNEIFVDGKYRRIDATAEITGGTVSKYTTERVY